MTEQRAMTQSIDDAEEFVRQFEGLRDLQKAQQKDGLHIYKVARRAKDNHERYETLIAEMEANRASMTPAQAAMLDEMKALMPPEVDAIINQAVDLSNQAADLIAQIDESRGGKWIGVYSPPAPPLGP